MLNYIKIQTSVPQEIFLSNHSGRRAQITKQAKIELIKKSDLMYKNKKN